MMDDETREAMQLSAEDLLRMAAEGKPARIVRKMPRRLRGKRDLNQGAADIVAQATEAGTEEETGALRIESDISTVIIQQARLIPPTSVIIGSESVTISR